MSFITGNDISNFQGQVDFSTYSKNSNFVICKSSEGTGYIDTWFGFNRQQARQYTLPVGFYHFARPDTGNTPQQEADFFCNLMNGDPLHEGEVLALDYEVNYSDPVGWCKSWLDAVSSKLGVKPLIYLNQSTASNYDWQPVVDAGYGLWIAAYTYDPRNNNFETGKWPFAAMQQWTDQQSVPGINGTIDGDVFFGDVAAFKAYGYHVPQPAPQEPITPSPVVPVPSPVENPSTPTPPVPVIENGSENPPATPNPLPYLDTSTPPKKHHILFLVWQWLIKMLITG